MDRDTETETRTAELTGQSKARQNRRNTDTGDTGGHEDTGDTGGQETHHLCPNWKLQQTHTEDIKQETRDRDNLSI